MRGHPAAVVRGEPLRRERLLRGMRGVTGYRSAVIASASVGTSSVQRRSMHVGRFVSGRPSGRGLLLTLAEQRRCRHARVKLDGRHQRGVTKRRARIVRHELRSGRTFSGDVAGPFRIAVANVVVEVGALVVASGRRHLGGGVVVGGRAERANVDEVAARAVAGRQAGVVLERRRRSRDRVRRTVLRHVRKFGRRAAAAVRRVVPLRRSAVVMPSPR